MFIVIMRLNKDQNKNKNEDEKEKNDFNIISEITIKKKLVLASKYGNDVLRWDVIANGIIDLNIKEYKIELFIKCIFKFAIKFFIKYLFLIKNN